MLLCRFLDDGSRKAIDLVLFGTESGVDHSKSAAVWVHHLTGIQKNARSFELKQACYSATGGIKMALGHIALNPESKALVIGSDIAKYGLNTSGEPTQGAGAVAMVISSDPRILVLDNDSAASNQGYIRFLETPFILITPSSTENFRMSLTFHSLKMSGRTIRKKRIET